jgi:rhodanese-related sulfurtransferase
MTTVAEMVAEARASIENLGPHEAFAEHEAGAALLVDIREPDERADKGVIPGTYPAPRGMLEFYADPASAYHRDELHPDRRIVLYCASGGRSALAAVALTRLGYVDVAHLDGGLAAWSSAGLPVVQVEARPVALAARSNTTQAPHLEQSTSLP